MSDLMRAVIDSIIPPGSAWTPAPGLDYDLLLDGIAENWETIRLFLADLEDTRNPKFTPFLEDLEREFGVLTNPDLTEEQRRTQLIPIVYNRSSNGSIDNLQQALDDAGFNVQVHSNDPAVNPDIFMSGQVVFGDADVVFGSPDAYFSGSDRELLVNGDIFRQTLLFTTVFGDTDSYFGNPDSNFGSHLELQRDKIVYEVPSSEDWPFVFFVGGDAIRDGSGFLTDIDSATVPIEQESVFKRIILKYKPIHSWAGLIIEYV